LVSLLISDKRAEDVMSKVDDEKAEQAATKKLAEAAAELAKLQNRKPLTKDQAEELTRRST
jgi:hypothetical protein